MTEIGNFSTNKNSAKTLKATEVADGEFS